MSARLVLRTLWLTLLIGAGMLSAPRAAHAQSAQVTCSVTTNPTINFGSFSGLAAGQTAQATVGWTCNNPSVAQPAYATLCINIGDGSGGVNGNIRLMQAGAGQLLQFQLYQDSADVSIWGSQISGANNVPYQSSFMVPPGLTALAPGTATGSATVYGVIPGGQVGLTTGSYLSSFGGANAEITVASSYSAAPSACGIGNASTFNFTVSATVTKSCVITAANKLDFGTPTGLLASSVEGTTTVETQCTSGTAFQIGLDRGQHASGDTRRMLGSSGDLITYDLYQDSTRATRWGNTQDTDTVSGTGSGAVQTNTVYGRVAAQVTPTPGTYTDTITVSVVY